MQYSQLQWPKLRYFKYNQHFRIQSDTCLIKWKNIFGFAGKKNVFAGKSWGLFQERFVCSKFVSSEVGLSQGDVILCGGGGGGGVWGREGIGGPQINQKKKKKQLVNRCWLWPTSRKRRIASGVGEHSRSVCQLSGLWEAVEGNVFTCSGGADFFFFFCGVVMVTPATKDLG